MLRPLGDVYIDFSKVQSLSYQTRFPHVGYGMKPETTFWVLMENKTFIKIGAESDLTSDEIKNRMDGYAKRINFITETFSQEG